MNFLPEAWITSPLLVVCTSLVVFGLIVVHVARKNRSKRQAASSGSLRAKLIDYVAANAEDPIVEAELDRSGFVAVALRLLAQIDGTSRERLVDLMRRRAVDGRLRRDLRRLNKTKRAAAAGALRFFPSPETRSALLRALRDRDVDVRLAAASSLAGLDDAPPLDELLSALARNERSAPARLERILRDYCDQDPNAVIAAACQKSLHPSIRAKAIEALAASGDGRHVAAIQGLISAPEADLRAAVLRAFARAANLKARDAIALSLRDENWFVRAAAADTAGRLGLYDLVPQIAPLVDDEQWWVRYRASEALEKLDTVGRRALRQMAKSGSARQRRQAALTLSKRLVA